MKRAALNGVRLERAGEGLRYATAAALLVVVGGDARFARALPVMRCDMRRVREELMRDEPRGDAVGQERRDAAWIGEDQRGGVYAHG